MLGHGRPAAWVRTGLLRKSGSAPRVRSGRGGRWVGTVLKPVTTRPRTAVALGAGTLILFGLSTDYHVFVVSRIREAVEDGMDTTSAVRHGITRTAGVVTSAAAIMVAVFATLSMMDFKQMGVGLAAAVAIDATLIRIVLLPAAMVLLGDRNWGRSTRRRLAVRAGAAEPVEVIDPVSGPAGQLDPVCAPAAH
ncbi:MMPL family transporter [Sporichthya sp.]|uniref:MMPL family transporter n=1 Tax=Sporichthya sp. TaxID=65475 RepID=UPI0025FB4596|nr:MMPL family transporter [Sporichthya sp.]